MLLFVGFFMFSIAVNQEKCVVEYRSCVLPFFILLGIDNDTKFLFDFAADVDSWPGWRFGVYFQHVVVVRSWRSAGQLRVRAAVRLALARVTRRHDPQNERQSQRRRL